MISAIKQRRSIRSYQDKPVEEAKVNEILKAAIFSPSARHLYPWEFVVVKDEDKREKLAQATPWASFAAEAPVVIAVLGDKDESEELIEDCSIAAEHMLLEIDNQNLGSCWIQIRGNQHQNQATGDKRPAEDYVRNLLDIPENYMVLCLIPIGYPAQDKQPHSEDEWQQRKQKIHWEQFKGN